MELLDLLRTILSEYALMRILFHLLKYFWRTMSLITSILSLQECEFCYVIRYFRFLKSNRKMLRVNSQSCRALTEMPPGATLAVLPLLITIAPNWQMPGYSSGWLISMKNATLLVKRQYVIAYGKYDSPLLIAEIIKRSSRYSDGPEVSLRLGPLNTSICATKREMAFYLRKTDFAPAISLYP